MAWIVSELQGEGSIKYGVCVRGGGGEEGGVGGCCLPYVQRAELSSRSHLKF